MTIKITRIKNTITAWLSLPEIEGGRLMPVMSGPADIDHSDPKYRTEQNINRGAWWEHCKPAIYAEIIKFQKRRK